MTSLIAQSLTLLAQTGTNTGTLVPREKLTEVSKHFNEGLRYQLPWDFLLAGLGALIIAVAAVSLRRWWINRQDNPSPLVLYSAIARKAGLTWSDRFMLWRMARACNLSTPIALLLARGTLRHYARQYAANRSAMSRQRFSQRLSRIESTLFG